jgi:hypothetical protein
MKHHNDTETKEESSQSTSLFLVTTEKSNLSVWSKNGTRFPLIMGMFCIMFPKTGDS